jgi:hypothetical protein
MSSATDACTSALNDVWMPRRTRGSASVQCCCALINMENYCVVIKILRPSRKIPTVWFPMWRRVRILPL